MYESCPIYKYMYRACIIVEEVALSQPTEQWHCSKFNSGPGPSSIGLTSRRHQEKCEILFSTIIMDFVRRRILLKRARVWELAPVSVFRSAGHVTKPLIRLALYSFPKPWARVSQQSRMSSVYCAPEDGNTIICWNTVVLTADHGGRAV